MGPGLENGTAKPFMLVGSANHTRENELDGPFLTWQTVRPRLTGWKRHVLVAGALHYNFFDYPFLFDTLGVKPTEEVGGDQLHVRTMEGARVLEVVTSYVGAFLDFVLHGRCSEMLEGPKVEFPEVTFEY